MSHLTDPPGHRTRSAWRPTALRRSNGRSIEHLLEFYTEGLTVGRSAGVLIERVFEL
jgi:hypothetical protein